MRPATADDIETLVDLMDEFYAESGYVLDRRRAARAFAALLADPRLGRVWLIDTDGSDRRPAAADEAEGRTAEAGMARVGAGTAGATGARESGAGGTIAGYVVVTLAFGMEHGGLMATVDDFYVRPAFRNRGIGGAALARVRELCAGLGVRAVTVEVGAENGAALAVYGRTGFVATDRLLMTLRLAESTHVE